MSDDMDVCPPVEHAAPTALLEWARTGRRFVVATLVEVEGSAPFDEGAMMLIGDDGAIEGSVTGGCVEGALVEEAEALLAGGASVVRRFGISDEQAVGVGLMCGGTVHVLLHEPTGDSRAALLAAAEAAVTGSPAALATVVDGSAAGATMALVGDDISGTLSGPALLDRSVERDLRGMLHQGMTGVRRYGDDGAALGADMRVFVRSWSSAPSLIIFGAIDFSAAVAALARQLGYTVTIVDAREPFLASPRFKANARTVAAWPDRFMAETKLGPRDAVLVFTHDPKFDEPALLGALASDAGYIGALGSRRTHEARVERLQSAGVADADIARISAPCGLDIGARTPAETAVSILAEIIGAHSGRDGGRLVEAEGSIHTSRDRLAAR